METIFYNLVLDPVVKKATEKTREALGPTATPEQIEHAVINELIEYLNVFTHATTKPSDYVGMNLGLIQASIAAVPTPTPKRKFD